MGLGVLATINQRLDWDIIELLAEEFGYQAQKLEDIGEELFDFEDTEDDNIKQILLFIGAISAIGSIALIVLLIKR